MKPKVAQRETGFPNHVTRKTSCQQREERKREIEREKEKERERERGPRTCLYYMHKSI
jgi:hypothetical protein